jgi:hypothetical protein
VRLRDASLPEPQQHQWRRADTASPFGSAQNADRPGTTVHIHLHPGLRRIRLGPPVGFGQRPGGWRPGRGTPPRAPGAAPRAASLPSLRALACGGKSARAGLR